MSDIKTTILFQTFKRPEACQKLLASIEKYYPAHIPDFVIINDDSEQDKGLSWGRNFLVSQAKTPYVLIIDDDTVFTDNTKLEILEAKMDNSDLDMLGFECGFDYVGSYKIEKNVVHLLPQRNKHGLYDYIPNMFIARRDSLLKYKWDDRLKIGEHFAYFYEHYPNLKIDYTTEVSILHEHITTPWYKEYRSRGLQYAKQYMREKGIARLVRNKTKS